MECSRERMEGAMRFYETKEFGNGTGVNRLGCYQWGAVSGQAEGRGFLFRPISNGEDSGNGTGITQMVHLSGEVPRVGGLLVWQDGRHET